MLFRSIAESEASRQRMKTDNIAARKAGQEAPYTFELTNLGANIRRMQERIEHLRKVQAIPTSTVQGSVARMEDCPAENRVRLFFPGKPSEEVRRQLKSKGFRWTPSLGCWQAYRNAWSVKAAEDEAQDGEEK